MTTENISGIYQIQSICKPERIYVGSTVNITNRWNNHIKTLRINKHKNSKLQNHYNKYGESDLQFSVLLGCEKEELIKNEQFFIDSYNPFFNILMVAGSSLGYRHTEETLIKMRARRHSEETILKMSGENNHGYGVHRTGENAPRFGTVCSEETKRKMSESHKGNKGPLGHKMSDEQKRKLSEVLSGKNNPMYGIPFSKEHKKKISDSKKGKPWTIARRLAQKNRKK